MDALSTQNQHLRTRVSELEVINDLFRGRVSELEQAEQGARRDAVMKDEEVARYKADLATANMKVADLQKRVAELESRQQSENTSRKRTRRTVAAEDVDEELAR